MQKTWTDLDNRQALYSILSALDYAHSLGIMHKDIKPSNILVDAKTKEATLNDWGHADWYVMGKSMANKVGTGHFKGPELLLSNYYYDY